MIIDQLFTRPLFEQAPMASPEQLAYNRLRAQHDGYQAMTGGGGNAAVSRDPAHAAKLATVPAELARMAAALKAKGIDAEAEYEAIGGPKSAPVDANQLYEFAPSDDDSNGSDPEELLRSMAAYWWNGNERQMAKVENTLAAMGWEIGQDDGYDDGGVFVVRAGDEHGGSYISWPHEDLELNEGRKKKKKKTSRSLGRYFFPGFGYYGSGESGEGGGDGGGGGESVNPGMAEGEYDSRKPFGVRYKVFAGREGRLTTREYYTSSEEKLQRAVDKIQALDNFYEIDGYSYPKEQQGVTEGSEQKPAITYKDYTLQYDYQTEDDDPEGYSTATTYYFDVLKDGDRVGEAEYFDYFGNLTIIINGQTMEFKYRHPLAMQISQLVSSLPDEQKKDLSDPRFESQGVAEGMESFGDEYLRQAANPNRFGTFLISVEQAQAELDARAQGKSRQRPATPTTKPRGFSKEYLQSVVAGTHPRPVISKEEAQELLNQMNENINPLMKKLRRALIKEGRVKELADDLKTMSDADFMKKYGKAKAAIRADMKRVDETRSDYTAAEMADMLSGKRSQKQIDADAERTRGPNKAPPTKESTQSRAKRLIEKLTTSDTLARPAARASSSGKAIDDPDIMGSLRSSSKFDRLGKTGGEPEFDFRSGLVGGETEVEAEPRLMVDPLPDMQKWGGKFATGSAGGDNRFTAPSGWRYVEKDEDPARYGSGPAAATSALPNLIYDPQSRTLKSADAPALDMSPKSNFKFDRTTQSQMPADGSGANRNIDNATRDRARAYAAQQNAPGAALAGAMRSSGTPVATAKNKTDWKTIYNLNKATIGSNPNLIRPGMKLSMPDGSTYRVQPGDNLSKIAAKQSQINELSTEKLAQYKTAAAADAKKADQEGDFKRGDRRFSGIVKATKKQFDNDAKQVDESRAARRALMAQIVNHR